MAKLFTLQRFKPGPPLRTRWAPSTLPLLAGDDDDDLWIQPNGCPLVTNKQPVLDTEELAVFSTSSSQGTVRVIIKPPVRLPQVFVDQDELGTLILTVVDEDGSLDLRPVLPLVNRQSRLDGDDHMGALGGFRLDEDYWQQPYQQTLPSSRLVFSDPDEPGVLGGFRLDEEPGPTDQIPRQPVNRQFILDTEELAQLLATIVDEEGPELPRQQRQTDPRLVYTDDEQGGLLGGFRLDEEHGWTPTARPLGVNRQPAQDLDALSFISVDDEPSPPSLAPRTARSVQPFYDTDELATPAATALDEDGAVQQARLWILANRLPIIESDESGLLGGLRVDEDYWQRPLYLPFTVNRQPILDTEELGVLASFGLDEDLWQRPWIQTLPLAPRVAVLYDEGMPVQYDPRIPQVVFAAQDRTFVAPATARTYEAESQERGYGNASTDRPYVVPSKTRPFTFPAGG